MALKTHEEFAELYRQAITDILIGKGNKSYSIGGRSFTKYDLESLERLAAYHERQFTNAQQGHRVVPDVRKTFQQ